MGLPVQSPPTDDERATMCVCKPRPTLPPSTPTPTSSPTLMPTPTPSPNATLSPTPSPNVTLAPTPTPSPSLMAAPSQTLIRAPTPSPSLSLKTVITVKFNDSMCSGDEADGVIAVTLVASGESPVPYNVTITPSELLPVSARELFDYSNDTIVVTFNPGETEKTVLLVVNPDCTRENLKNSTSPYH